MNENMDRPSLAAAPSKPFLRRLFLTGFMGAGKSTIGELIARRLGWKFLDLDQFIEAECSQTVAEIFREHGESHFRAQERACLDRLRLRENTVIALGGGTIEDPAVLGGLLQWEKTCLIYLDAPLQELLQRIDPKSKTRPLLTNLQDLEMRHQRRLPSYRSAHITIGTTGLSPNEVAAQVIESVTGSWRIDKGGTTE